MSYGYGLTSELWTNEDRAYECGFNPGSPFRDAVGLFLF